MLKLSKMQRRYIWLAGSHPRLVTVQGQGRRTERLLYGIDEKASELVLFGYGTPLFFMVNKGLFRGLQAPHAYTLTESGETAYAQLLARGGVLNDEFLKVPLVGA